GAYSYDFDRLSIEYEPFVVVIIVNHESFFLDSMVAVLLDAKLMQ
ncbi:hypothetical protein Goarm_002357, partial [Gossypium armourianum]|nr:hypothetical protein [Gossypium armourianum]